MAAIVAKAPGKIILFGEHAVVYGQPAIAIPVNKVKATARVFPEFGSPSGSIRIQALDIDLDKYIYDLDPENPIAAAVILTLETLQPQTIPPFIIQITSTIPIAAGMGSGAAVTVAILRAVSAFVGKPLPDSVVSELSYEVEKIHHGTPSGIDNNVITYGKPVYFVRDQALEFLEINQPTHWIIADTGEKTPTFETVSDVRKNQAADPQTYNTVFRNIGETTQKARTALIEGDMPTLGDLLNQNQVLLQKLDVSSPKIEKLLDAARDAGAAGAKLSGGGRGGNIIALVSPSKSDTVRSALIEAGAVKAIDTKLSKETS